MVHGLNPTGQDDDAVTVPDVLAAALVTTSGPDTLSPALLPVVLNVNAPEFCRSLPSGLSVPAGSIAADDGHMQAVHAAAGTVFGHPRRRRPGRAVLR